MTQTGTGTMTATANMSLFRTSRTSAATAKKLQ
jgi:hypothetical protein